MTPELEARLSKIRNSADSLHSEYGRLTLQTEAADSRKKDIKRELARLEADFVALQKEVQAAPAPAPAPVAEPGPAAADAAVA